MTTRTTAELNYTLGVAEANIFYPGMKAQTLKESRANQVVEHGKKFKTYAFGFCQGFFDRCQVLLKADGAN